jgi:hypothetical protein
LKNKAKDNKKTLDQLLNLGLSEIKHTNQVNFDKPLLLELMIRVGKISKANALKVCDHYEQIVHNEENPQQRLKLAKTLLALLDKK